MVSLLIVDKINNPDQRYKSITTFELFTTESDQIKCQETGFEAKPSIKCIQGVNRRDHKYRNSKAININTLLKISKRMCGLCHMTEYIACYYCNKCAFS